MAAITLAALFFVVVDTYAPCPWGATSCAHPVSFRCEPARPHRLFREPWNVVSNLAFWAVALCVPHRPPPPAPPAPSTSSPWRLVSTALAATTAALGTASGWYHACQCLAAALADLTLLVFLLGLVGLATVGAALVVANWVPSSPIRVHGTTAVAVGTMGYAAYWLPRTGWSSNTAFFAAGAAVLGTTAVFGTWTTARCGGGVGVGVGGVGVGDDGRTLAWRLWARTVASTLVAVAAWMPEDVFDVCVAGGILHAVWHVAAAMALAYHGWWWTHVLALTATQRQPLPGPTTPTILGPPDSREVP